MACTLHLVQLCTQLIPQYSLEQPLVLASNIIKALQQPGIRRAYGCPYHSLFSLPLAKWGGIGAAMLVVCHQRILLHNCVGLSKHNPVQHLGQPIDAKSELA